MGVALSAKEVTSAQVLVGSYVAIRRVLLLPKFFPGLYWLSMGWVICIDQVLSEEFIAEYPHTWRLVYVRLG